MQKEKIFDLVAEYVSEGLSVSEISRIMCPEGRLLLSLPGLDIPKHEKLPFQRDYRRVSVEQIENLLGDYGFRNIEVDTRALGSLQTNILVVARR